MTDTQPTMEELRAKYGAQGQNCWMKKYAAEPGSGPAGKTCASCAWKRYTGNTKHYPKCGKTAYTHGDATTIKTSTPACRFWEQPQDKES